MKKYISIIIGCAMLTSCTITKKYNFTVTNEQDLEKVQKLIENSPRKAQFEVSLSEENADHSQINYDASAPNHIRIPQLIERPGEYNPADKYTFPIYGNPHTVEQPLRDEGIETYAIWCTKNATYLAYVTSQYWDLHYHQQRHETFIRDVKTDTKYYITEALGLPMDISYNIKGVAGTYVCFVLKFPPLPASCTKIDIVEGCTTDVVENGLSWYSSKPLHNVSIADLQANQNITKYKEIKVIE